MHQLTNLWCFHLFYSYGSHSVINMSQIDVSCAVFLEGKANWEDAGALRHVKTQERECLTVSRKE